MALRSIFFSVNKDSSSKQWLSVIVIAILFTSQPNCKHFIFGIINTSIECRIK